MASEPAKTTTLTEEQRRAVSAARLSVGLSAGAGCGKTFVLTERFLAELEPSATGAPARLSQIIAITFTERAAREMRERIHDACTRRLLACPESEVRHWLELVREIDSARISTIHSFCGALLRSHAVEAGLDPRFGILDATQSQALRFEMVDQRLRDLLASHDVALIEMTARFGLRRLLQMVEAMLGRRNEIEWDAWTAETPEGLVARWRKYWREEGLPRVLHKITVSPHAQRCLRIALERPSKNAVMLGRFATIAELLPFLPQSANPAADLAVLREAAKVQGGGGKKDWASDDAKEDFGAAAKALRDLIDKQGVQLEFDDNAALPAAQASLRLLAIAGHVAADYDRKKTELAVLDFDDLLIRAWGLLVGPARASIRKQLCQHLRLLLVDEFQDTDPLQVELVKALCDNDVVSGKLFFVGDFKQSIYRFRGAQPHVFRTLRDEIAPEGRLPLSLNFRSQPAVLEFVNALFCLEMGEHYEALRASRTQVSPRPAVEFLWACDEEDDGSRAGATDRARRVEAEWIARRIRGMLDSGEPIAWDAAAAKAGTPKARPVQLGDIAILFRAMTDVQHYEEALRSYGIDYYLVGGKAFYSQQEVFDLANLLQAIDNPADDVSLLGALRSPMFCVDDETIFWLSQNPAGLSGSVMAGTIPAEIGLAQREQLQCAIEILRELRAVKDRLPIARLVERAIAQTGYDALLLAEFLGQRKLANLRKLVDQARSFDRSGIFTLADFITQLREFVARQPDEALAATHAEKSDVVRLMSIHQSKGLEFPVVFVADLDRPRRIASDPMFFTPELGPMVKDANALTGYDLHAAAEHDEDEAELARLLYVATTRAADYLVLSAGRQDREKNPGPWLEILARNFDLDTGRLVEDPTSEPLARVTIEAPVVHSDAARPVAFHELGKLAEKSFEMAARGDLLAAPLVRPIAPEPGRRRQFSFSRLHGKLQRPATAEDEERLFDNVPEGDTRSDRRGLGTLVHAALAEIDFRKPDDISELVRRHAARHLPDGGDAIDDAIAMVERFTASPRAAELANARQIHAELEFLLAWPVAGDDSCAGRHIQGFIDCLYQDANGGWRLLDYKTNRVDVGNMKELADSYEMQMLLYGLAVEKVLGVPPTELVLHFLRPSVEYPFPWNDAARQRAVELVNRGLAEVAEH